MKLRPLSPSQAYRVGGALLARARVETARCRRVLGASGDVIPTLVAAAAGAAGGAPRAAAPAEQFDFVFMDHWKGEYATDLRRLEALGLLAPGCAVLADNVLFPGAPELLDYLGVSYVTGVRDETSGVCVWRRRTRRPRARGFAESENRPLPRYALGTPDDPGAAAPRGGAARGAARATGTKLTKSTPSCGAGRGPPSGRHQRAVSPKRIPARKRHSATAYRIAAPSPAAPRPPSASPSHTPPP